MLLNKHKSIPVIYIYIGLYLNNVKQVLSDLIIFQLYVCVCMCMCVCVCVCVCMYCFCMILQYTCISPLSYIFLNVYIHK